MPPTRPAALPRSLLDVVERELPNGLRVRLLEDHRLPVVSYTTVFRVGSRNERPGTTGMAHLFEHMMFNGAQKYGPGEFDRIIEAAGGHSNAYTSNDLTVYHEEIPPTAVAQVVDLEADRMRSLSLTPENLENERNVVKEERSLRVDNDIPGMVAEDLEALVFRSHPYRWPVIGWGPDLDAISREDCAEFFRVYYAPTNATVWVVGDVDAGPTMKLIERAYGDIPRGPVPPRVTVVEPTQRSERRSTIRYPAQAPFLAMAWPAPKGGDDAALVFDVLQFALSQGDGSLLTRKLVFDEELATSADVSWGWRIDPGAFAVFVELKPGGDPEEAEALVFREIEAVARRGLNAAQLRRAHNLLRAQVLRELSTVGARSNVLGAAEVLRGTWRDVAAWPRRYASVTSEQVCTAAARLCDPTKRSVVTLVPA